MDDIIKKYLKTQFGEIEVPIDSQEKIELARALLGSSIVEHLDYWLDYAKDLVENKETKEPFSRVNEYTRKDKSFRDTFSKLDQATKAEIIKLINTTATGIVFSLLVNFDQFDFGELILSLKPKSTIKTEIKISSDTAALHDELTQWIFTFSKFKDELVEQKILKSGVEYRLT